LSSTADVNSGVSQGSVLGPILFSIFYNDVASTCSSNTTVEMFADDLKLYSIYNSANSISDLQQFLDLLVSWSKMWKLKITLVSATFHLSVASPDLTPPTNIH
jgi:ribonucleases P/MRP protein subunit RPP40